MLFKLAGELAKLKNQYAFFGCLKDICILSFKFFVSRVVHGVALVCIGSQKRQEALLIICF
ncbi:hypothetical protein NEOC95_001500 [Neochlamydia sp. AcF95]|nr:hypothetical protein [Neochlamydia sp. AcF95]